MTDTCSIFVPCKLENAVLRSLSYFGVFAFPLTQEEVFSFCGEPEASLKTVSDKLEMLVQEGRIFKFGIYFQAQNDATWAQRRLEDQKRATAVLPKARKMARFIAGFPFVRGVFISGSLSKHSMRAESDVDFFVVTAVGRLWIARTLLILFKKIFLLNSHKYFCVNYFVDTEHLEIAEKNLFTATETVTLLPMYGREYYADFCSRNAWAWSYYPHFQSRSTRDVPFHSSGQVKNWLEKISAGKNGDWLDQQAMYLTVGFWKRKFRHMDPDTFDLALKSRKGISKHHPLHFQEKVLRRFEVILATLTG